MGVCVVGCVGRYGCVYSRNVDNWYRFYCFVVWVVTDNQK